MKKNRNYSWKDWDMPLLKEQLEEFTKQNRNKVFVIKTTNKKILWNFLKLEKAYPKLFKSNGVYRSHMRIMRITPITICFVAKALKNYPEEVKLFISEDKWLCQLPECFETLSEWNGSYNHLNKRIC